MPNSQGINMSQSAWAMDAVEEFETSPIYTAMNADSGSAGELQNDYTIVHANERYENDYALSCSNYGITWTIFHPAYNPPAFSEGTGVQIGYSSSLSTASLPAGNYKLSSDWGSVLNPDDGFTLSIWINEKAIPPSASPPSPPPAGPGGTGRFPFVVDWPLFHFGTTGSLADSERGSLYFGLVKDFPSAISPVGFCMSEPWMQDRYRFMSYIVYSKSSVFPDPAVDMVYSSNIFEANEITNSSTWKHVALTYHNYPGSSKENRWRIYLNGVPVSLSHYMNPNPTNGGEIPKNWQRRPIRDVSSIGVAKKDNYPFDTAPFGAYMDPTACGLLPATSGDFFHIFNGLLDEATIWSEALNESQITELYGGGRASDISRISFGTSSLASWYRFGDTPGDTQGIWDTAKINDLGNFGADAANVTDLDTGIPTVSASILPDRGLVVFSTEAPLAGTLEYLSASPLYNRKQTLQSVYSVVDRHGVQIPETALALQNLDEEWSFISCADKYLEEAPLGSIQPFGGTALWEADRLAGYGNPFVSSSRSPFYDTYDDYSLDTKYAFKEGTILSEFRISEKIKKYIENEDFLVDSGDDFSIFGIPEGTISNPQNSSEDNFNTYYSNSEFMQFFDIVRSDHDGVALPEKITIKCKGLKKFIPYDGFYPAERSLQIASQFSKSYAEYIEPVGGSDADVADATNRPIMAAMFSPGIMYNSIKAGMAVDYPVSLNSVQKLQYNTFISGAQELTSSGYWALGTGSAGVSGWDYRVPFEALLEPEEYLKNKNITDMEPDPSASLGLTTRLGQTGDNLYKLMINNFLAEIPEFFLRNDEFTAIRSIPDNSKNFGKVEPGKTYGMRVKMRRSMNKTRKWFHPSFVANENSGLETITEYEVPQDPLYQPDLRETFTMYSRPTAFGPPVAATDTLYKSEWGDNAFDPHPSRVDAGFAIRQSYAGNPNLPGTTSYTCSAGQQNQDLYPSDSLNGYNPSFTPPYYNGEAWADILYTAPSNVTGNVSLDDILNNSKVIYWRIDGKPILRFKFAGQSPESVIQEWQTARGALPIPSSSLPEYWAPATSSTLVGEGYDFTGLSSYNPGRSGTGWYFWGTPSAWNGSGSFPMAPLYANKFAMQLSASINLLGREDVLVDDFSADGTKNNESTVNISGRWVIQPKFETPMFNFGDQSIRPISNDNDTLTIPTNGSESVPRGMWHQYGCLPRPNEGIFLEVADIPDNWVRYRGAFDGAERKQWNIDLDGEFRGETAGTYRSEYYDDYGAGSGVSSLMDVAGFTKVNINSDVDLGKVKGSQKNISKKLGQLKEGKTVSEAIVAIPFYMEDGNQKLFGISNKKIQAIIDQQNGITPKTEVNILSQIGPSLYDLVEKMQKFVLPPRYDFVNYPEVLNNPDLGAFAMYIFEFSHTFTSEDLSHIWQNVMPNAGLKSVFGEPEVEASITHDLVNTELLDAEDFEKEIRWHVFKVKQRAAKNYFEKTTSNTRKINTTQDASAPSYNWPYDFFSLIELGNMSTEVSLKNEQESELGEQVPGTTIPKFNYKENQ